MNRAEVAERTRAAALAQMVPAMVATVLREAGGEVYIVGGAVRDVALGRHPNDIDLLVRGLEHDRVDQVLSTLYGAVKYTGEDFGVFRFRNEHGAVEVALPRRDRSTGLGHKTFEVTEDPYLPIEEDLLRRDFTVNAMAVPLSHGPLIDPLGGLADAEGGVLRILTDTSMSDDPLRTMRGLVMRARFGLGASRRTFGFMRAAAHRLVDLPGERLQAELDKLLQADNPAAGIDFARMTGTLPYFLPEVAATFGYDQNNPHHELDLGQHLLEVLRRAAKLTIDPDVRFAALLHDIGKPASAWTDPVYGTSHYYEGRDAEGNPLGQDHEVVGARLAYERLGALRWPQQRRLRIVSLINGHMFPDFTTKVGARRFLSKYGTNAFGLMTLRRADQGAGKVERVEAINRMDVLLGDVVRSEDAVSREDLKVNGRDVVDAGVSPSPRVGRILDLMVEAVVEDPSLNERDTLLAMLHDAVLMHE
jgi:tRNA nucleotidyltransferase (CCA-adding enzyme)